MARRLSDCEGIAALDLNISCPNVSGGVDFGTDPAMCLRLVQSTVEACRLPILAKLTPNVTDIASMAQAVADAGADAVSLINTCLGVAVDWRRRRPLLGNMFGGLSGPAIKPIALAAVCKVSAKVAIPIIGIGGIANIDDVMEFLIAGATAVQIGTANFYNPHVCMQILDALPASLRELNANSIAEIVGTLVRPGQTPPNVIPLEAVTNKSDAS
jgi:dihydroorotate dehydrogenase (NAD+) catalytic subunit